MGNTRRSEPLWLAYTDPPGPAASTTARPPGMPRGHWAAYPWPCGDEKAAGVFIRPQPEWRATVERLLPGYVWPQEPDRTALEVALMAAPYSLRPADFDATLTIPRLMAWVQHVGREPVSLDASITDAADAPSVPALDGLERAILEKLASEPRKPWMIAELADVLAADRREAVPNRLRRMAELEPPLVRKRRQRWELTRAGELAAT